MNSIQEIFTLETWEERINFIKKSRHTPMPVTAENMAAWFCDKHRVYDKKFRKDMKTLVKDAYVDDNGKEYPPEFETEEVARIALPIEQDIVNIHVAFTVGNEPLMKTETEDKDELDAVNLLKKIHKDNKLRYANKRELRSWLSEQEVCEYWYRYKDTGFWQKVWNAIKSLGGINAKPTDKLRMQIWSPFKGDKLYPIYADNGNDFLGIGREYEVKLVDGSTKKCFMLVTDEYVYNVEHGEKTNWTDADNYPFKHGFSKIPVIYSYRPEALCKNIKGARESLETLTSDYSDAIKMNFFPKLILEGDLANGGAENIGKSHLLKITNGGKAYYLDWHQTSDMVKTQMDNLLVRCYSLTNTPLIAFDQLKNSGQFPSGTSFEYMFMATLFAVDRHWEEIGEFYQRRVNFLLSAIGSLVPSMKKACETVDVDLEQRPYRIEDLSKRIADAATAVDKGVMSRKQGVILVGITDEHKEELESIEEDLTKKSQLDKSNTE
ncbi:MAG: phage portal protein [Bacteroidaceae bacterium]|nr:phage portal protein [Bacteroidaceae bacterium]